MTAIGLHICAIVPVTNDPRGEWVEVANDGLNPVTLTGLELTDYTETQQRPHVYRFPALSTGAPLRLGPGNAAFVFTGTGKSEVLGNGDVLLFAGRAAPVWNNTGDVAYLRNADGTFVRTMTVGHPRRHPNGH
jgi:hypothetical protein